MGEPSIDYVPRHRSARARQPLPRSHEYLGVQQAIRVVRELCPGAPPQPFAMAED